MTAPIHAYARLKHGAPLEPFDYDPGPLKPDYVEIRVEHCGLCHSDLSMLDNQWGRAQFPMVAGHEVVGTIVEAGDQVKAVKVGDRVGLGWFSGSCLHCPQCLAGDHNLCRSTEGTLMGRFGGFADRVRCQWLWAVPLPQGVDVASAGPLFCGGITVFNPIVQFDVKPTDRVGVVGIGGLGHLAIKFLNKWGCEVTAFTSSDSKHDEAKQMGAHRAVSSTNKDAIKKLARSLDFVLVTVNVALEWPAYLATLKPRGKLHFVGAVTEPLGIAPNALLGQKSLSGSPLGSPATIATMLEFCARHQIAPITETFPMTKVNDALEHLRAGKARYRIILNN
jgi:alcohol/geraniol dehydrogenase (NADP+)